MSDKLPAYQWYPGDWRKHGGVQALTYEEKGVWRELLDFMHESDHRGRLVYPSGTPIDDAGIARMLGIEEARWKQIRTKLVTVSGVANEGDDGALESRRMLKDEHIRQVRSEAGKKGGRPSNSEANANQNVSPSVAVAVSPSTASTPTAPEVNGPSPREAHSDKRRHRLPGDWIPQETHTAKARELRLNLDSEAQAFKEYHIARGNVMVEWNLAFHTWLRNSARYRERDGSRNGKHQPASSKRPLNPRHNFRIER